MFSSLSIVFLTVSAKFYCEFEHILSLVRRTQLCLAAIGRSFFNDLLVWQVDGDAADGTNADNFTRIQRLFNALNESWTSLVQKTAIQTDEDLGQVFQVEKPENNIDLLETTTTVTKSTTKLTTEPMKQSTPTSATKKRKNPASPTKKKKKKRKKDDVDAIFDLLK